MFYEIILDRHETANKCTVAPLAHRPDFRFTHVGQAFSLGSLASPILLHPMGKSLTDLVIEPGMAGLGMEDAKTRGIACVDCIWRRLDGLVERLERPLPVLARIPDGFVTAYPRRNKKGADPDGGLATIEAIFVAAALIGHWDPTLFSAYYFGSRFVSLNTRRLIELGVPKAWIEDRPPTYELRPKTSAQRRADRGTPRRPGAL